MPGSLQQWLETFMCGQFAENFERYGYRTLQAVCQLQLPQLLSIGIPRKESEIILQNIHILRQSTATVAHQQQMQHGMSNSYNSMSHDPHGTSFQGPESLQEHPSYMPPDNNCYNYGNSSSNESGPFYNQGMSQSMDSMMRSQYPQQYQGSGYPQQQQQQQQQQYTDNSQFSNMGMSSPSSGSSVPASRHGYHGQVPGSPLMGQSNIRHSHPHLRKSGQSPQEVANNILHMAASSYPTNNTIQVPLSKNRSAPYHIPSRSPNYNSTLPDSQQHMCSDYGQGQFAYPSPPHQSQLLMQSREPRLSPLSPASVGMMSSPHSHQTGRTVQSPNTCSMNSPSKGMIRSPGPQLMNSPQRGQYQTSPMNNSNQRMISPVPPTQQLKVTVPSSVSQPYQQCYYGNMMNSSQYQQFQQPMSARYSPSSISQISDNGQYMNSPGSQGRNFTHSPGGRSGHLSNISSPYTPGSASYMSPNQTHNSPPVSQNMTDCSQNSSPMMNKQCQSPLQSLHKLCMLPDSQVVDPKTVVKEACVSSVSNPCSQITETPETACTDFPSEFNSSPAFSEQASVTESEAPRSNLNEQVSATESEAPKSVDTSETVVSPEMQYQPKKMMLLRAAKDDLCSPQNEDTEEGDHDMSENENSSAFLEFADNKRETEEHNPETINDRASTGGDTTKSIDNVTDKSEVDNVPEKSDTIEFPDVELSENQNENIEGENQSDQVDEGFETNGIKETQGTVLSEIETGLNENVIGEDSSHSIDKCDKDSKAGGDASETVQSVENILEVKVQSKEDIKMAYASDSSLSGTESQIAVRKDSNKTYSKQEKLKSFEISPRLRGDSTGSLSDDIANSDYEYEDHIGCDDIDTGFSDIEDKSNEMIDESVDDAKDLTSNITNDDVVLDGVVITGTSWKKNGKGKTNIVSSKSHKTNGFSKRFPFVRKVAELDLDDVPSPVSGDDVDGLEGPIGVDNGDGTVSVTRPSHLRRRKTPVKYKDTSFFQGDFVFVEEEEEFKKQTEPRRKPAKRSANLNHSPKRNGVVKGSNNRTESDLKNNDAGNKSKLKSQTSVDCATLDKTKKVVVNLPAKNKSEKRKGDCNFSNIKFMKRNDSGKMEIVKNVSVVETVLEDKKVLRIVPIAKESSDTPSEAQLDEKHVPSQNSAAVTTRASKQETSIEKDSNTKRKVPRRQLNGLKTDSVTSEKKVVNDRAKINKAIVNQKIERTFKSGTPRKVDEESKPPEEVEVIEIDSDDSGGADKDNGAKNSEDKSLLRQPKTSSLRQSSVKDENCEDENGHRNFMFSLVEDETIDESLIEKNQDNKIEIIKSDTIEKRTSSSESLTSKKSESKSNLRKINETGLKAKSKSSKSRQDKSKQSGKGVKRKAFIDDDPDFEFGTSKRPIKSSKLDKSNEISNSNKAKKRTDKWANFKGPKIIFEGEKANPNHCVVINDPLEESMSKTKKTKTITQNVTRIEISQLPSDKSVLIPFNDISESDKWTCALCGKHSSFKFLGDLFGPYTVETMSDEMLDLSPNVRLSTKKRKSEERQFGAKVNKSGRRSDSTDVNEWKEVWVHEACSVYSDGVFLIGSKIYGLQEAVRIASQTPCSSCNELGAMIGCLNKGCQQKYHHACAQEAECYLDDENFSLLCPKHKVKKLKQLEEASTSASVS